VTDRRPDENDDDVVYLEGDGRDDVARALEEAERAVSAVEERHKKHDEPARDEKGFRVDERPSAEKITDLVFQLEEERERAIKAEEEAGRMREALLRKSADFENLKRRTEREKTDFFKFALAEVIRDLLAVLDNFERAMEHRETSSDEDFRRGISMIAKQLGETLRKYGLTEVPAEGLPFDPNVHEAIASEATAAAAPGTVLSVLQKGYALNDRLLRPARVKVAGPPAGAGE
jgi:molecular chaperone GrpE